MPYRVRLPDLDAHRLKETRNPYQTSVRLKTTEKISQQSAEAPEQEQSTLAETSFVESVDRQHLPCINRRHLPGIDRHQTDGYEPAMERQATKEEIPVEKRVKSRKPYIPKHLRKEVNKEELEGFYKRVKRVPKDMSFMDAYHTYRLGNFFRESRETDKDIELLFNKVSHKPKRTLKKEQDPGKFLIPCSIHSHHLPNALCDTGYAEIISCIEMFEDPGPTADSNHEPAIPESESVDIKIAPSVDFQSSESIDNQPSASDDSQSSESIDTKPSALVDTLRISEQLETEKSKSGGRTRNRKKKKKRNADSLSVVPLQCQEASLAYRVRCKGGSESFIKVRVLCDPELRDKGEASARELHRRVRCLAMDGDFPTSGQSASQEEAVEEMKDCRSITQH
ncbi:hypothetical protein DY000_02040774 [Brassica cretica]|uniref:Uncharacterized protein n=1 Tax=Brassica cretica TaxID=69181 RepID=A0ABQ7BIP6_BRACR|nr:hypothetical protein DY000_02040774 [Brassica cretica]